MRGNNSGKISKEIKATFNYGYITLFKYLNTILLNTIEFEMTTISGSDAILLMMWLKHAQYDVTTIVAIPANIK